MRIFILSVILIIISLSSSAQVSYDKLIRKGVSLHERGMYREAINYYQEAYKLNKEYMAAPYEMSLSYLYMKDYANALKYSTEIINKNFQPLLVDAYCVKSTALAELDKVDQSIKLLNQALAECGDQYLLHYNLGLGYFKIKNTNQAITHLSKAIEIEPTHADAFLLYAYTLGDAGKWVQSFLSFQFFLLLEPNSERSKDAFVEMYDILDQKIADNSPLLQMEEGIDRRKLYQYLQRYKPKDDDLSAKYQYFEKASKSIFFTLGQLQDDTRSGLLWDFYVPIYSEILESGYFETYCRYISSSNYPESLAWWQSHNKEVDEFIVWFEDGQGSANEEAEFGDDTLDDNVEAVDEDESPTTNKTKQSGNK